MLNPSEIENLLKRIQKFIRDDDRASEDPSDETPAVQVTVATTTGESWGYQTGDNSYTGAAYSHPYWSVQTVDRKTDCAELAKEIVEELESMVEETAKYAEA